MLSVSSSSGRRLLFVIVRRSAPKIKLIKTLRTNSRQRILLFLSSQPHFADSAASKLGQKISRIIPSVSDQTMKLNYDRKVTHTQISLPPLASNFGPESCQPSPSAQRVGPTKKPPPSENILPTTLPSSRSCTESAYRSHPHYVLPFFFLYVSLTAPVINQSQFLTCFHALTLHRSTSNIPSLTPTSSSYQNPHHPFQTSYRA